MLNKEKKRQSIVGQGEDKVNGGDHGRFLRKHTIHRGEEDNEEGKGR